MRTFIVLEVTHDKPITDLAEHAAQRVYTMDGVSNVETKAAWRDCESVAVARRDYKPTPAPNPPDGDKTQVE